MKYLLLFAPELVLLSGGLIMFILSLIGSSGKQTRKAALGVGFAAILVCLLSINQHGELFYQAYRIDLFSQVFKLAIAIGFVLVLLLSKELKGIREAVCPEYYLFMMISTAGLTMLVSSVELLTLFVALELASFSMYLMVPMRDDRAGLRIQMESAAKYILFGIAATGIMLFGMSYLFGLTGTTYLSEMLPKLHEMAETPVAIVAIAMVMAGFFYKLAIFPFHFWVPDVYQGASNETTAFIASVPKIAAVALLIRIVTLIPPDGQALVTLIMGVSICSMFYGNLVALVQKDIKRMLAFSGIAHAGFMLIGLVTMTSIGYATAMYYIFAYMLMICACFLVICNVSKDGENVLIEDLRGLHQRAPLLALTMAVSMFAMAGLPPFVGFMGKFMVLTQALQQGFLLLVIMAVLNTAFAIYYYLSVVKTVYVSSPKSMAEKTPIAVDGMTKAVSVVLIIAMIFLCLAPGAVLDITSEAVKNMVHAQ
jgi:NADH-quinone oxidoreductase subunit N